MAGSAFGREGDVKALVFVHGVGSTAAIWDHQLEAFGDDRVCAAIELRGNGACKPDPDPSLITREGFAEDVLTVADALQRERFTLVGCSLGGVVAFELWPAHGNASWRWSSSGVLRAIPTASAMRRA